MSNLHDLIIERNEEKDVAILRCKICPSFRMTHSARSSSELLEEIFGSVHADQYDEGRAPSITVDWEPVSMCSICDSAEIVAGDDGGVTCERCYTWWDNDGKGGATDEDRLAELFDEAWDMAHVWAVAGRDAEGHIRMRSGAGELVAARDVPRSRLELFLPYNRTGSEEWLRYRAALDLLDREAAE